MGGHQHHDNGIEQVSSEDLPVFDKPVIPEDAQVIILVEETDQNNGGKIQLAYRLPVDRITPVAGIQKNSYSLFSAGSNIDVPEGEVVPAYIETFDPHTLQRANGGSETTKAQVIVVANDNNAANSYIVMGSGFYRFPEPHNYEVGQRYYLSDSNDGEVTIEPDSPTSQPLFYVVDLNTIQIAIGA